MLEPTVTGCFRATFFSSLSSTCPVASQSRNKSKPKSSYPSLKPQYLQSPWLGINLCLQSSSPEANFQNHYPMAPFPSTIVFSLQSLMIVLLLWTMSLRPKTLTLSRSIKPPFSISSW
ncbi:hypothetical protein SLA2020_315110 [Shorea laevis]